VTIGEVGVDTPFGNGVRLLVGKVGHLLAKLADMLVGEVIGLPFDRVLQLVD
jgi:hypothetical protein